MYYWKNSLKNVCIHPYLFAVALTLLGTLSGCEQRGGKHYQGYYPVDSIITAQIHFLASTHASAVKVAKFGGKEETSTIKPADSIGWINEFDIFRELKTLNKPINQGAYRVENDLPDNRSNLKIKSIATQQSLPVRSMKIYYYDKPQKVKRIEAQFNEVNSLYSSERFLVMEFQDVDNKTVLSSYSIDGGQKMFLGDTVTYSIKGTVVFQ